MGLTWHLIEFAIKRMPRPGGRFRGWDEQFVLLEFAFAECHENRTFHPRLCSMKGASGVPAGFPGGRRIIILERREKPLCYFLCCFCLFSGPPLWSLAGTGKEAGNANK